MDEPVVDDFVESSAVQVHNPARISLIANLCSGATEDIFLEMIYSFVHDVQALPLLVVPDVHLAMYTVYAVDEYSKDRDEDDLPGVDQKLKLLQQAELKDQVLTWLPKKRV